MLFRKRRTQPAADALPPAPDPVIDSSIHWLGSRGLVKNAGVSTHAWVEAADDSTDPLSLALATVDGIPCVVPSPVHTVSSSDFVVAVNAMADDLELPIDDVTLEGDTLTIRSIQETWDFATDNRDQVSVLVEIAALFVDSMHVLLREGTILAIVHRDIEEQARIVMSASAS